MKKRKKIPPEETAPETAESRKEIPGKPCPNGEGPQIICSLKGPFTVIDLEDFRDHEGKPIPVNPVMPLCRCGYSKNKPFCDGSHVEAKFSGEKAPDRVKDRVREYKGKEITILDNRGVCAHDMACINLLPSVFSRGRRPWIDPDGADVEDIIKTIEKCPSGALSYRIGDKLYKDLDRSPAITVAKDGPLEVVGWVTLKDDMDSEPESEEHYTLCRCGKSRNKPFCDGSHLN